MYLLPKRHEGLVDQSGLAATLGTVDKRDGTRYEKVKCSHKARSKLTYKDIRPDTS